RPVRARPRRARARASALGAFEPDDDPVAVAAVERLCMLDRPAAGLPGAPGEQEQRRADLRVEERRLVPAGDRRLDRLLAAGELDVVAVAQELVERHGLGEPTPDVAEAR